MIEIRTIREQEADSFLQLLCCVFDLDYPRAHSIFFTEPLFDLSRKWALFDCGRIVSILTTVPLEFGWGRAVGIAGVATALERQGEGLAGSLLSQVVAASAGAGEAAVMLFAKDTRLYERAGFQLIDQVLRGPIVAETEREVPMAIEFDQVRTLYDQWSRADDNRLRRGDLRWKYWKWNLRVCTPVNDGYLCFEGGVIREVVMSGPLTHWELPLNSEWLGLGSMADRLGLRVLSPATDLHLMGLNVPSQPQFFMTDQF
jgi:predicted N-acetyltransferase YhbS